MYKSWKLFLDDQIHDSDAPDRHVPEGFIGAASSAEAMRLVQELGPPEYMDLDHDLGLLPDGSEDNAKVFLKWLTENYWNFPPKDFHVHSANVASGGKPWIESHIRCWKNVCEEERLSRL